jgi:hypothetical protein
MSKRIFFVLAVLFSFFCFRSAQAGIIINEIMYDLSGADTDHEWVEILNSDSVEMDLTGWKFFDGSNHNLNQPPINGGQGSLIIPAGNYAIFSGDAATFLSDHPGFSGTVIDTVMSLSNTGTTLKIIKPDSSVADSVTYGSSQGASGDGNSLQLINGTWQAALPTPGIANQTSVPEGTEQNPPNSSLLSGGSLSKPTSETKQETETPKIKTKATVNSLAYAKIPIKFSASTTGYGGETLRFGRYYWNFGDGDSKEIEVVQNGEFTHTYYYPGDYKVILEYYLNSYSQNPETVNKFSIKVISATVSISRVGEQEDFFIELSNDSDYDTDISKWMLWSAKKTFVFPKGTSLEAGEKMILSPKITNFSLEDKDSLKLLTSSGEIASSYQVKTTKTSSASVSNSPPIENISASSPPAEIFSGQSEIENIPGNEIFPEDNLELPATSILAETQDRELPGRNSRFFFWGFVGLLILSGGAAYYIRRGKNIKNPGEDFKIIDG